MIMLVMKKLRSMNSPSRAASSMAIPIATTPRITGITPDTTDPNTSTRTTRATAMPMVSPVRRSSSAIVLKSLFNVAGPAISA